MEEIIKNLNKSTLFRLSLGSKELFHSNFIAWVAENSLAFNQAIFEFLDLRECCIKPTTINREKEHIDLWIEYKIEAKTINVIIENKVKSLPYRSQLDSYAEKQEPTQKSKKNGLSDTIDNHYILLSLYKPSFVDDNDCYKSPFGNWKYLSYTQLAEIIKKHKEIIARDFEDSLYAALIIDDYIKFIQTLNRLGEYIHSSAENKQFYLSHSNQDWKMFYGIRMGDFYDKLRYAILAEHLYDELVNKQGYHNVIMGVNPGTCQYTELGDFQNAIYINTGMSRSNGLVDVKMILDPKDVIQSRKVVGIQIQDGQLRRLVETDSKSKAIDVVIKNKKIKDWFVGKAEGFGVGPKVKKQIDGGKIRYHSFDESFVYRWRQLGGESYALGVLLNIIIKEIKVIQNL